MINVIGLSGVAGSGKDTVFERMDALYPDKFERYSIADPLKESVAALLDITLEQLEEWKRSDQVGIQIVDQHRGGLDSPMTFRTLLQRYGTEAHRGVFGENFWLDAWESEIERRHRSNVRSGKPTVTYVNTSVRFQNEAQLIQDLSGEVWYIEGPQDEGAGGHESEQKLPEWLIDQTIDNSVRDISEFRADNGAADIHVDFRILDQQIRQAVESMGVLA